ncbi:DCC1-like thiol-disulfide oxidoreductase family protein [Streptomyces sp. NPDC049915]|uniref:thiol-disulfide oxidoreductase DCC family protein n=1 Tax=Streptomyces sp. NPDC049915 TaxID=3155510 RepID=UPI0034438330
MSTATPSGAMLLYDGDCGLCHWSVTRLRKLTGTTVRLLPWQAADLEAHRLTERDVTRAVQWIPAHGPVRAGHAAFAAWLSTAAGTGWRAVGRLLTVPPISWTARGVYRLTAGNRGRIPGPWRQGASCRIDR